MSDKKRIFSGIQPSGNLHIGNYLGAIANWIKLQDEFESIFCVVDLHAITVPQDPDTLRKKTLEIAKIYLAAGIDPKKSSIFIQSQVSEHAELCWILNTIAKNGDLNKMTQFKDKTGIDFEGFEIAIRENSIVEIKEILKSEQIEDMKKIDPVKLMGIMYKVTAQVAANAYQKFIKERFNNVGVGLFDYPVLMAADILLYGTEVVPVGEDQKQHVEYARDTAQKFNKIFGKTFKLPEPMIMKDVATVPGLDGQKMSKSYGNTIPLFAEYDEIKKCVMKIVTDSGNDIPENVFAIHKLLRPEAELKKIYEEKKGKYKAAARKSGQISKRRFSRTGFFYSLKYTSLRSTFKILSSTEQCRRRNKK